MTKNMAVEIVFALTYKYPNVLSFTLNLISEFSSRADLNRTLYD